MIPPQTVLNLLKIGISGEQDGPKHTSNTFAKIISKMWCLQASHKSSLPIFFSKLVQALFHCPVFITCSGIKAHGLNLTIRPHSSCILKTAVASCSPVPEASLGIPKSLGCWFLAWRTLRWIVRDDFFLFFEILRFDLLMAIFRFFGCFLLYILY